MKTSKFKKKGSVMISMLFSMMVILIVTAVFVSHLTSVESSRMAQKAAQIIAETRALAVDIPLKEQYGYVEVLHDPYTYATPFPVQPVYDTIVQGYDKAILSPTNPNYELAVTFADDAAKQAGLKYIDGTTSDNGNNTKLLNIEPENICIEVISLPDEVIEEMELGCGPITLPGTVDTLVNYWGTENEVPVYGSKHRLNGFTGATDDLQNTIQNYNFVFVMVTYQENTFFYKAIQRFAHGTDETQWSAPPTKSVWAIAYPQADFCTGADC